MAKVKAIKFYSDFCQAGVIKYAADKAYPKNDETLRCVLLNFGEEISIDEKQVENLKQSEPTAADTAAALKAEEEKRAAIATAQNDLELAKPNVENATHVMADLRAAIDSEQDEQKKAELQASLQAEDEALNAAVQTAQYKLDELLAA